MLVENAALRLRRFAAITFTFAEREVERFGATAGTREFLLRVPG
jgi:hypothetical protein